MEIRLIVGDYYAVVGYYDSDADATYYNALAFSITSVSLDEVAIYNASLSTAEDPSEALVFTGEDIVVGMALNGEEVMTDEAYITVVKQG